jgi:hypothetical protein
MNSAIDKIIKHIEVIVAFSNPCASAVISKKRKLQKQMTIVIIG